MVLPQQVALIAPVSMPGTIDTSSDARHQAAFLSLHDVRKTYPGVVALDGFSIEIRPGEVIGLVGENGAGKSTLMKILGGVAAPDRGLIRIDGCRIMTVLPSKIASSSGIAFVHQELNLFENLDVAANIFLGREPLRGGPLKLVDRAKLREMVLPLLKRVGAEFYGRHPRIGIVASPAADGRDCQSSFDQGKACYPGRTHLKSSLG